MTDKQKRFCDEYLIDANATQAAIRAGYSPKTANEQGARLLANVSVKNYIEEHMRRIQSDKIATAEEVLIYLTAVNRGETRSAVLARNELGAEVVIMKAPDEKERLKAAELLAKRYGLLTDKIGVEGVIPVVIAGDDDLEE